MSSKHHQGQYARRFPLLGLFGLASAQDLTIVMENKSPNQELGMYWLGTEEGPAKL